MLKKSYGTSLRKIDIDISDSSIGYCYSYALSLFKKISNEKSKVYEKFSNEDKYTFWHFLLFTLQIEPFNFIEVSVGTESYKQFKNEFNTLATSNYNFDLILRDKLFDNESIYVEVVGEKVVYKELWYNILRFSLYHLVYKRESKILKNEEGDIKSFDFDNWLGIHLFEEGFIDVINLSESEVQSIIVNAEKSLIVSLSEFAVGFLEFERVSKLTCLRGSEANFFVNLIKDLLSLKGTPVYDNRIRYVRESNQLKFRGKTLSIPPNKEWGKLLILILENNGEISVETIETEIYPKTRQSIGPLVKSARSYANNKIRKLFFYPDKTIQFILSNEGSSNLVNPLFRIVIE